ncbi:HAD-IIIC family phosphatase [Streptomyces sp. NPDC058221]|uniref:HAD-IIIC family phosphatase n=1 Tax=Streptomyces sp. NPDC058221 TaxID=3346388 RepID=UPI0036F1191C
MSGTVPVAEDLFSLVRAGQLVERHPHVRQLIAPLAGADLLRAGRLLSRSAPDEILRAHPTTPTTTVVVTGHGMLSELIPALTAETARHGILLRPHMTDHDSYRLQLSDPDSEVYGDADLVLCVLDPAMIFDVLPTPWRPADVKKALAEHLALFEDLTRRFDSAGRGTLVLNTLPLPQEYARQLVDLASRAELGSLWRQANAGLLDLMGDRASTVVVDLDPLIADGIPVTEPRLDIYAKAHLSSGLLAAYAREVAHLARHLGGHTKKCLVVDLDETVWGGILGDDGIDGIEVADSLRGEAFRAFQRVVKQLGSQGVLVAAVSKNDLDPVREVLRDHPDMTLREEDFVRVSANWRPKHENLCQLAEDLNIGVDSLVFADDSSYERGLVRRELPGVAVVDLDEEPALHVRKLLADGWFDVRALTSEDCRRPGRYRDELVRKDFMTSFDSVEDYLRELGVTVRIADVDVRDIPRASQLTLRTNQFNMTTQRLQPADVQAVAADPATRVLTVHTGDRYGENGLVGVVLLRRDGEELHIENFVLSCRVFSRGVEQACLAAVLTHAKATGAGAVRATYRPTSKNAKVAGFYPQGGFTPTGDDAKGFGFRHDLETITPPPPHVRLTEHLGGTGS